MKLTDIDWHAVKRRMRRERLVKELYDKGLYDIVIRESSLKGCKRMSDFEGAVKTQSTRSDSQFIVVQNVATGGPRYHGPLSRDEAFRVKAALGIPKAHSVIFALFATEIIEETPAEKVRKLLAELPDDADEIATFLDDRGVKGKPGAGVSCPITTYLKTAVPEVRCVTRVDVGLTRERVKLPEAVRQFVDRFDQYGRLVLVG